MSDPLTLMRSFPPEKHLAPAEFDTKALAHVKSLEKLSAATWTKPVDKKSLLELLDPTVHTIAYLKCLYEQVQQAASKKDSQQLELLFDQACVFYTSFDPVQARFVGDYWRAMWEWTSQGIHSAGHIDLSALSTALLRLDPSSATFTTLHLRFIKQCLSVGTPSQALPILDRNIFAYPQTLPKNVPAEVLSEDHELSNAFITSPSGFTEKILPEYVLEYYLLGAHVYVGIRNYQRARLFLEHVILYPTQHHATSAFQVEAYKKWVLVGLLSQGKPFAYPRTVDVSVWKNIKAVAKAYDALADNFERRNSLKYHAELQLGGHIWADDGNARLVAEAGQALIKYRVSDLQKTYASLPVSRVAAYLNFSPEDTFDTLTHMIRHASLNASLAPGASAGDAILSFNLATSASTQSDLEAQTKRIERLITAVRDADCRLQLTKEHVTIAKRTKNTTASDAELADQMDLSWDAQGTSSNVPLLVDDDEDEDLGV